MPIKVLPESYLRRYLFAHDRLELSSLQCCADPRHWPTWRLRRAAPGRGAQVREAVREIAGSAVLADARLEALAHLGLVERVGALRRHRRTGAAKGAAETRRATAGRPETHAPGAAGEAEGRSTKAGMVSDTKFLFGVCKVAGCILVSAKDGG